MTTPSAQDIAKLIDSTVGRMSGAQIGIRFKELDAGLLSEHNIAHPSYTLNDKERKEKKEGRDNGNKHGLLVVRKLLPNHEEYMLFLMRDGFWLYVHRRQLRTVSFRSCSSFELDPVLERMGLVGKDGMQLVQDLLITLFNIDADRIDVATWGELEGLVTSSIKEHYGKMDVEIKL